MAPFFLIHAGTNAVNMLKEIYSDAEALNYELIEENPNELNDKYKFNLSVIGLSFVGVGPSKTKAKNAAAIKALKHHSVNPNASKFRTQLEEEENRKVVNTKKKPYKSMNKNGQGLYQSQQHGYYSQQQGQQQQQYGSTQNNNWLKFCQSFRNNTCAQIECKFLHVSRPDEEAFMKTGCVPGHILEQAVKKALLEDMSSPGYDKSCKAYLDGYCNRYNCPFRHISRREFTQEVMAYIHQQFEFTLGPALNGFGPSRGNPNRRMPDYNGVGGGYGGGYGSPGFGIGFSGGYNNYEMPLRPNTYGPPKPRQTPQQRQTKRLEQLKEQVTKLEEENKFLRDEFKKGGEKVSYVNKKESEVGQAIPVVNEGPNDQKIFEDKIEFLKEENEDIRNQIIQREREWMHNALPEGKDPEMLAKDFYKQAKELGPWWNSRCEMMKQELQKARRRMQKKPTEANKAEYKKICSITKRVYKDSQLKVFLKHKYNLNTDDI